jgi:hypothetical protein
MCTDPFRLQYLRRYHGEELGEEYAINKTKFHGRKRILISAAISWVGPEQLFIIEDKENTDVYEDILDDCLPNISRLQSVELIFMQDKAS